MLVVLTTLIAIYPLSDALSLVRFYAQPHSKVRAAAYLREQLPRGLPVAVALHPVQWANQPFVTPLADVALHTAAWYRAGGYRYLVADLETVDKIRYAELRSHAQVVTHIPGDAQGQPGSTLEILDLGTNAEHIALEPRSIDYGESLQLIGIQYGVGALRAAYTPLANTAPQSAHPLLLNLFFAVNQVPTSDYTLFVHVLNAAGQRVMQRDTLVRAADYPMDRWQRGEIAAEIADIPLPALPPGEYRVVAGLYDPTTGQRLPASGTTDGAAVLLRFYVPE